MPSIGVSYRSKEMKSIRETFAQAIVIVFINDRKTRRYPRNTAPSTKWAAGKHSGSGRLLIARALLVRKGQSAASCARAGRSLAERTTPKLDVLCCRHNDIQFHPIVSCLITTSIAISTVFGRTKLECGCSAKSS